jgi:ArsR family transcriptional regulator
VIPHIEQDISIIYNIFNNLNILPNLTPGVDKKIFSMTTFNPSAKLFKALMHPSRLMILETLRDGEQCVCHLEAVLGCRQAYISQHLMVLREAGLVEDRRDGARIFYRVIKPEVFDLVEYANRLSGDRPIQIISTRIPDCPCPKCNPAAEGELSTIMKIEKGIIN